MENITNTQENTNIEALRLSLMQELDAHKTEELPVIIDNKRRDINRDKVTDKLDRVCLTKIVTAYYKEDTHKIVLFDGFTNGLHEDGKYCCYISNDCFVVAKREFKKEVFLNHFSSFSDYDKKNEEIKKVYFDMGLIKVYLKNDIFPFCHMITDLSELSYDKDSDIKDLFVPVSQCKVYLHSIDNRRKKVILIKYNGDKDSFTYTILREFTIDWINSYSYDIKKPKNKGFLADEKFNSKHISQVKYNKLDLSIDLKLALRKAKLSHTHYKKSIEYVLKHTQLPEN